MSKYVIRAPNLTHGLGGFLFFLQLEFCRQLEKLEKTKFKLRFSSYISCVISTCVPICHPLRAVNMRHYLSPVTRCYAIALLLTMAPCQVRGSGAITRQGTQRHPEVRGENP